MKSEIGPWHAHFSVFDQGGQQQCEEPRDGVAGGLLVRERL